MTALFFGMGEKTEPLWMKKKLTNENSFYYVGIAESNREDIALLQARKNALKHFLEDIEVNIDEYSVEVNIQINSGRDNVLKENIKKKDTLKASAKQLSISDLKQKDFYIKKQENIFIAYVLLEISKDDFKKLENEWVNQSNNAYNQIKESLLLRNTNRLSALKKYLFAEEILNKIPNKYSVKARQYILKNKLQLESLKSIYVYKDDINSKDFLHYLSKKLDGYIFVENQAKATFLLTTNIDYEATKDTSLDLKRADVESKVTLVSNGINYGYAENTVGFGKTTEMAKREALEKLAIKIAEKIKTSI